MVINYSTVIMSSLLLTLGFVFFSTCHFIVSCPLLITAHHLLVFISDFLIALINQYILLYSLLPLGSIIRYLLLFVYLSHYELLLTYRSPSATFHLRFC